MIKILATGSETFSNKKLIKDFIFTIKQKYKDKEITIASLSNEYGTDKWIRKYCIEFEINYGDFTLYHKQNTIYDIMPELLFNKKYHPANYSIRNNHAINWADMVILFIETTYKKNTFNSIIKYTNKKNKQLHIIS